MAYADFQFYENNYFGDQIAEGDFVRLSERASDYIEAMTQGLSDRATGDTLTAVKKATCAIAETIQEEERMKARSFSGTAPIASESVGGWSRSYNSSAFSTNEAEYLEKRKKEFLLLYLRKFPLFAELFRVKGYHCKHTAR